MASWCFELKSKYETNPWGDLRELSACQKKKGGEADPRPGFRSGSSSQGIIRSMTPPYLPAGPAHEADPVRVCASYRSFFSIFCGRLFEGIFHEICLASGTPKSPKIAPGAEKVRSQRPCFAIFGATRRFMRFSADLEAKNDEKSTCFSVRVLDAARFYFQLGDP